MLTTTILPVNVNIYAQNENISKFTFPKGFLESLQKDVSGHYSNPAFGIEDIVFPEGWHGRQIPTGIGLIASVRPGNQSGDVGDLFGGGGGNKYCFCFYTTTYAIASSQQFSNQQTRAP